MNNNISKQKELILLNNKNLRAIKSIKIFDRNSELINEYFNIDYLLFIDISKLINKQLDLYLYISEDNKLFNKITYLGYGYLIIDSGYYSVDDLINGKDIDNIQILKKNIINN